MKTLGLPRGRKHTAPGVAAHVKSLNLYKFIKLVLGGDISDRQIARRWKMNEKNFHEFKCGKYPVPRLEKLEELAVVLGINKHLVFQVAGGAPARTVFELIRKHDLPGQIRLLSRQLDEAHRQLVKSEQRYRDLFNHAGDAIFVVDVANGIFLDCNKQAAQLAGRTKAEIIGAPYERLIPPAKRKLYHGYVREFVQGRRSAQGVRELLRPDGTVLPVTVSASVIESNGRILTHCLCREVR